MKDSDTILKIAILILLAIILMGGYTVKKDIETQIDKQNIILDQFGERRSYK